MSCRNDSNSDSDESIDGALTKSASSLFDSGMLRGKTEYLAWLQVMGIVWYLYEWPLRSLLGSTRRAGGTATSVCDTLFIRHMRCWYLLVSRGCHLNCCRRAEGLTLESLHDLKWTLFHFAIKYQNQYLPMEFTQMPCYISDFIIFFWWFPPITIISQQLPTS